MEDTCKHEGMNKVSQKRIEPLTPPWPQDQYSLSNLTNRISNHDKLCKHKSINMSPFQTFLHISKL